MKQALYIPPHLRQKTTNLNVTTANSSAEKLANEPKKYIPPQLRQKAFSDLQYSKHALVRQEQRDITEQTVEKALERGVSNQQINNFKSYRDENTLVVVRDQQVITVDANKRNTRFDILERTSIKQQELIIKAKKGNDSAMCALAELYLSDEIGAKNVKEAYYWLIKAANKNNSHAMCLISQLYSSGNMVEQNDEANFWLEKAAYWNNIYAMAVIGQKLLSQYQTMTKTNNISAEARNILDKAIKFLQKSADKGGTRAIWTLGYIHENGFLGIKNLEKAKEYYIKAAKLGSPSAIESLNQLVYQSKFDSLIFQAILDQAVKLIASTSSDLALRFGVQQLNGHLGNDPAKGLVLIEAAANKRHPDAIKILAKCYRDGLGCEINKELAIFWFKNLQKLYSKAAKHGNTEAAWSLGKLYLSGNLGIINTAEAEQAFLIAIQDKDPSTSYSLGKLYAEGQLGNVKPENSYHWIRRAVKLWTVKALAGDADAACNIGEIYYDGELDGQHDYTTALTWFNLAIAKGSVDACYYLAKIHLNQQAEYYNIDNGLTILEKLFLNTKSNKSLKLQTYKMLQKALVSTNNDEIVTWLTLHIEHYATLQELKTANLMAQYQLKKLFIIKLAYKYIKPNSIIINYTQGAYWLVKFIEENRDVNPPNFIKEEDQEYKFVKASLVKLYLEERLIDKNHIELAEFLYIGYVVSMHNGELRDSDMLLLISKKIAKNITDLGPSLKAAYLALQFANILQEYVQAYEHIKRLKQLDTITNEDILEAVESIINICNTDFIADSKLKLYARIVGDIYNDNILIQSNINLAINWYTLATEYGNTKAMYKLGQIYQKNTAVSDLNKAIYWYNLAAQHGNAKALSVLEDLAVSNQEFRKIIKHLLATLNKAVLFSVYPHDKEKQYKLGMQYLCDIEEQDYLYAALWFRKAVKQGHWQAAYELAELYNKGHLETNLVSVATSYYKQALKLCWVELESSRTQQINNKVIKDLQFIIQNINNKLDIIDVHSKQLESISLAIEADNHVLLYVDGIKITYPNSEEEAFIITDLDLLGDQLT